MGREVRRVPLDFDWPLEKTWQGFINPHYTAKKCLKCKETGYATEARLYKDQWYGNAPFDPLAMGSRPFSPDHPNIVAFATRNVKHNEAFYLGFSRSRSVEQAIQRECERLCRECINGHWMHHLSQDDVDALIKEGRLHDLTSKWEDGQWIDTGYRPSAAEVNEKYLFGFGHDSINCCLCVRARCERKGEPVECDECKGHGCIWPSLEAEKLYDEWEQIEPPTGEGWQIWETVSDGSPISPVLATPEELARHMAGTSCGADKGTSYEQWLTFIGVGWAPSMIVSSEHGVQTGVQAVGSL